MIKERNHDGFVIFDIDSNGDNYESFKMSVEYFKMKAISKSKYYGGFDTERFYFEHLNIPCEITYTGFFGTELRVKEQLSEPDLQKVRHWSEEIYKAVHNNESPI